MAAKLKAMTAAFATRNRDADVMDSRYTPECIDGQFYYPPHRHCDFFDWFYIVEGQLNQIINGKNYIFGPGSLFWIRKGDCHEGWGNGILFYKITGKTQWLDSIFSFLQISAAYHALLQMEEPPHANVPSKNRKALYRKWERCWNTQGSSAGMFFATLLTETLFADYFLPQVEKNITQRTLPEWFQNAINYILEHVGEEISAEELGDACHKSPEHVSRSFRKYLDITPSQYINLTRFNYVRQLLSTTALPITEIALRAGFNNMGHFFSLFKKNFNMSPRTYRLRYQDKQGSSLENPISPKSLRAYGDPGNSKIR